MHTKNTNPDKVLILIIYTTAVIVSVMLVDQFLRPGYWIKSLIKAVMFCSTVLMASAVLKSRVTDIISLRRCPDVKKLIIYMFAAYIGFLVLFLLFKGRIDLHVIKSGLEQKEHLTKENCIYTFIYIIVVNSFLEEMVFRGLLFNLICKKAGKGIAAAASAFLFSVYHIGIVSTWLSPLIFLISIIGLMIVGLVLQYISDRYDSMLAGWCVHASANIAINSIGVLLFWNII